MKGMFHDSVVPYLMNRFGSQGVVTSYRYGVYDIREIDLENTLMDLIKNQSNPTIALLIKKGYIEVRITANADTLEAVSYTHLDVYKRQSLLRYSFL